MYAHCAAHVPSRSQKQVSTEFGVAGAAAACRMLAVMHYCPITQLALVRCETSGANLVRAACALVMTIAKRDCCLRCLEVYGLDRAMRRGVRAWAERAINVLSASGDHGRAIDASRRAWLTVLEPPSAKLRRTLPAR